LDSHWVRLAASRAFCTDGSSKPINTPMMAIITSSSINVKPVRRMDLGMAALKIAVSVIDH
jgi:hypothetical protein